VTVAVFRDTIIGAQCAIKVQASVCLGHYAHMADQKHMGALDGLIIWCLSKHLLFKFFFQSKRAGDAV